MTQRVRSVPVEVAHGDGRELHRRLEIQVCGGDHRETREVCDSLDETPDREAHRYGEDEHPRTGPTLGLGSSRVVQATNACFAAERGQRVPKGTHFRPGSVADCDKNKADKKDTLVIPSFTIHQHY